MGDDYVTTPLLSFSGSGSTSVFIWVPEITEEIRVGIKPESVDEKTTRFLLIAPDGCRSTEFGKEDIKLQSNISGIWEIKIEGNGKASSNPTDFRVNVVGKAFPFIAPGPGIVPSHFPYPEPVLKFAGTEVPISLWVDVPDDIPLVTVQTWLPRESAPEAVSFPDGSIESLEWRPGRSPYRIAEIVNDGRAGLWEFQIGKFNNSFRFTILEGLPLFLSKPVGRFPYARIHCRAYDESNIPIDARFQVFRGKERLNLDDTPAGEAAIFWTIPGPVEIRASQGIEYAPETKGVILRPAERIEFSFQLRRVLHPDPGWVCGDHHTHSYFEDGSQSPKRMAKASLGEGLDYFFLSDEPEPILEAGLKRHNKPGRFLALPGQEIGTPKVHMNALNIHHSVILTESERVDPGLSGPSRWLDLLRKQATAECPNALMLNHPSHISEVAERHGYFRSWWIADGLSDIVLVENFDFAGWFERLNSGRRLVGLWTTDTHDPVFIPPGFKRTYVYVGEELSERAIIEGLLAGRCFNTRHPGALLYLTVDGALPGEEVTPNSSGRVTVDIKCEATRPIDRVELVGNGKILSILCGHGSNRLHTTLPLYVLGLSWLLARVSIVEEPLLRDGHSLEPLMAAGYVAFTNPVWIRG